MLAHLLARKAVRQYYKIYWLACHNFLTVRNKYLNARKTGESSAATAVWHLVDQPCDWNFYLFLQSVIILAEYRELKLDQIIIIKDRRPNYAKWLLFENISHTNRFEYRVKNLLLPAVALFPQFKKVLVCESFTEALGLLGSKKCIHNNMLRCKYGTPTPLKYLCDYALEAKERRLPAPLIKDDTKADLDRSLGRSSFLSKKRIVTLTVREVDFDKTRNTNIEDTLRFASLLSSAGYKAVIIPDSTNLASNWIKDCSFVDETSIRAATCHEFRYALYCRAFCNYFVPHGFMDFATFSDNIPYVGMKFVVESYGNPKGSWTASALYRFVSNKITWENPEVADHYRLSAMNNSFQILNDRFDSIEYLVESFNIFLGLNHNEVTHLSLGNSDCVYRAMVLDTKEY